MKKQNTSYKEMLRDRVPLFVDLALKWCKAKEIWINHVYNNFINIYVDKDQRYHATSVLNTEILILIKLLRGII